MIHSDHFWICCRIWFGPTGAKECVEAARLRIEEEVSELEQQVSIDCVIPQKFHRTIMGSKGVRVQSITTEFGVRIKFPEKSMTSENDGEADLSNGQSPVTEAVDETPKPCDIIAITGTSCLFCLFSGVWWLVDRRQS